MASNKQTKSALNSIKMQAASEVGVALNNGYNGDLTARQAGSIGGQMVKEMFPEQQWVFPRLYITRPTAKRGTEVWYYVVAGI